MKRILINSLGLLMLTTALPLLWVAMAFDWVGVRMYRAYYWVGSFAPDWRMTDEQRERLEREIDADL